MPRSFPPLCSDTETFESRFLWAASAVARRGLFPSSRNLLNHKGKDSLSGGGHEGGFGPVWLTLPIHDRMPVILDPDAYDVWLDLRMVNVSAASELLKPYDARTMQCYHVSTRVNHVANEDAACSAPVEVAQIQDRLLS